MKTHTFIFIIYILLTPYGCNNEKNKKKHASPPKLDVYVLYDNTENINEYIFGAKITSQEKIKSIQMFFPDGKPMVKKMSFGKQRNEIRIWTRGSDFASKIPFPGKYKAIITLANNNEVEVEDILFKVTKTPEQIIKISTEGKAIAVKWLNNIDAEKYIITIRGEDGEKVFQEENRLPNITTNFVAYIKAPNSKYRTITVESVKLHETNIKIITKTTIRLKLFK